MSKYQEALNYLDFYCSVRHAEQQDLLQELVDKETPMKPIQKPIGTLGLEIDLCICGTVVNSGRQSRCSECGQVMDWSDEE